MEDKRDNRHAMSMQQYGVGMVILTTQGEIDDMTEKLALLPLSQVRSVHKRALEHVRKEERYFETYPERLLEERERYQDLCDDCVIVTLTGMVGFNKPGQFVHPSVISSIEWDPNFDLYRTEVGELIVDYDESIPTMQ
jgi:hypothetical protein